jgi:hypothetical protein
MVSSSTPHPPLESAHVPDAGQLPSAPAGVTMDKLLTPTGPANDPEFVHLGNLRVERSQFERFEDAQRYLTKNPEAIALLHKIETAPGQITMRFINDGNDRFVPSSNTIYWDPKSALLNKNGSVQTPALGLLHEEDHCYEHATNPKQFEQNVRDVNVRYQNAEEQRVITGIETRSAKTLSEGTRTDHGGVAYEVEGPTHTISTEQKRPFSADNARDAINGEVRGLKHFGYSAPADAVKVSQWDHKGHSGPFVHLDGRTVAQHLGKGEYMVYDVKDDLHGVYPPAAERTTAIEENGNVRDGSRDAQSLGAGR